jgi:hypothetical protein
VAHRGVAPAWTAWVTAGLVWLFCHQLGYAWRGWELGQRPLGQRMAVAGVGPGRAGRAYRGGRLPPLDGVHRGRGRIQHLPGWLWLLAPSAVLALLVALFARVEFAAHRPRRTAAR